MVVSVPQPAPARAGEVPALLTACAIGAVGLRLAGRRARAATTPRRSATRRSPPTRRPIRRRWSAWPNTPAHNHLDAPRIAVGRIADYTGKEEADGSGRKLTQGASLMAISRPRQGRRAAGRALRHLGLRARAEVRQQQADLRRARSPGADHAGRLPPDHGRPGAGLRLLPRRRHHRAELQHPLRRRRRRRGGNATTTGLKGTLGGQHLRHEHRPRPAPGRTPAPSRWWTSSPTRSRSSAARSASACSTSCNGNVFDVSAGEGALEPMQLAVRSVIERAVLEMMANLYGMPGPEVCLQTATRWAARTTGVTGALHARLQQPGNQQCADPRRSCSLERSLAIPLLPLFSGAATSQSVGRQQPGPARATSCRPDPERRCRPSPTSTSATTATGNAHVAADGLRLARRAVDADGSWTGNVTPSRTSTSRPTAATGETSVTAAATGNTGEADSLGGGPLTGNLSQNVDPGVTVKSEYDCQRRPRRRPRDASVSSQAIANSMGFAVANTTANVTTNQTNSATVDAEGGSEVGGGSGATLRLHRRHGAVLHHRGRPTT